MCCIQTVSSLLSQSRMTTKRLTFTRKTHSAHTVRPAAIWNNLSIFLSSHPSLSFSFALAGNQSLVFTASSLLCLTVWISIHASTPSISHCCLCHSSILLSPTLPTLPATPQMKINNMSWLFIYVLIFLSFKPVLLSMVLSEEVYCYSRSLPH